MPLGLPDSIRACLFDLDGVLTDTASIHEAAWKAMFDEVLAQKHLSPSFSQQDYNDFVDGKPRDAGTSGFLDSRKISASPDEVAAMGKRKNELFLLRLHTDGVTVYPGSLAYLEAVRAAGLRTAVVSSSTNCKEVCDAAKISQYLDVRVDGVTAKAEKLAGKPAPDTFLDAANELGLAAAECAVFEDALAGVEAGRAGRFGFVVGVDRVHHAAALKAHGATRVVTDLQQLLECEEDGT
ncbi:MAG: beta-phosphoglucomutase family hydrolase [Polyangia bacterium]